MREERTGVEANKLWDPKADAYLPSTLLYPNLVKYPDLTSDYFAIYFDQNAPSNSRLLLLNPPQNDQKPV